MTHPTPTRIAKQTGRPLRAVMDAASRILDRPVTAGAHLTAAEAEQVAAQAVATPTPPGTPATTRNPTMSNTPTDPFTAEQKARADWAKDAEIRAEFSSEANYVAWRKADANGQINILGRNRAAGS